MKKIFVLTAVIFIVSVCNAQEITNQDWQEINLNTNSPAKTYKVSKPNIENSKQDTDDDENDTPFNLMYSPLEMLKQYQQDNKY